MKTKHEKSMAFPMYMPEFKLKKVMEIAERKGVSRVALIILYVDYCLSNNILINFGRNGEIKND